MRKGITDIHLPIRNAFFTQWCTTPLVFERSHSHGYLSLEIIETLWNSSCLILFGSCSCVWFPSRISIIHLFRSELRFPMASRTLFWTLLPLRFLPAHYLFQRFPERIKRSTTSWPATVVQLIYSLSIPFVALYVHSLRLCLLKLDSIEHLKLSVLLLPELPTTKVASIQRTFIKHHRRTSINQALSVSSLTEHFPELCCMRRHFLECASEDAISCIHCCQNKTCPSCFGKLSISLGKVSHEPFSSTLAFIIKLLKIFVKHFTLFFPKIFIIIVKYNYSI